MYLINPNEPNLSPILGWVWPLRSKFGLNQVELGPRVQIWTESGRVGRVHLTALISTECSDYYCMSLHSLFPVFRHITTIDDIESC